MTGLDTRTLEALVRLNHDDDFSTVIDWLQAMRNRELEECATTVPETGVRMIQGRAAVLKEIIDAARMARTTLEKLKQNQR